MAFNGVNTYIEAPTSATYDLERTDSFTFSVRINTSVNGTSGFIEKWMLAGAGQGYYFGMFATGKLLFSLQGGAAGGLIQIESTAALSLSTSYHVAVTYDGSSTAAGVKLYVNGVSVAITILIDSLTGSILTANSLRIGSLKDAALYYNGSLNVVRGWDFKMTAANVLADYNSGVPAFPTFLSNMILGNNMGDGGIFGVDTWVYPDTSSVVTGFQGYNLVYVDRVTAI
jgi:hypothetical protein